MAISTCDWGKLNLRWTLAPTHDASPNHLFLLDVPNEHGIPSQGTLNCPPKVIARSRTVAGPVLVGSVIGRCETTNVILVVITPEAERFEFGNQVRSNSVPSDVQIVPSLLSLARGQVATSHDMT